MRPQPTRRSFLGAAVVGSLTGCLGGTDGLPGATGATETPPPGPPIAPEALPLPADGESLRAATRAAEPPGDGAPPIDDPAFVDVAAANERLAEDDLVFGLVRNGVTRAYPRRVLVWHQVVNDTVDGAPLSVTYSPLTGTALAFERGATTFAPAGRVLNSNLLLIDRETEHWWPQLLATAIPGPSADRLAGRSLREMRLVWSTWGRWRSRHPDTTVLSFDTGVDRRYGEDPYGDYEPAGGYYGSDALRYPRLRRDDRFGPKRVVFGVRTPAGAAAVPKSVVRDEVLVTSAIGGTPVLWVYDTRLDTAYAYRNPDRVAFREFMGVIQGPEGNHRADELPLPGVLTVEAMWFAWSGFYPETTVYG